MTKSKAGGGFNSKQHKDVGVRTGQKATGVLPAYPGTLGEMRGNHASEKGRTRSDNSIEMYNNKTPPSVPLGNQVAANVGAGGPGTGREVMRIGSQGQHGAANPGSPLVTGAVDRGPRAILGKPGQKV
jgi:hypothetical protein